MQSEIKAKANESDKHSGGTGDPMPPRPSERPARKKLMRMLAACFGLALLVVLGFFGISRWVIGGIEAELFANSDEERYAPAVAKDLAAVAASPLFRTARLLERAPAHDAGTFFNSRLPWTGREAYPDVPSGELKLEPRVKVLLTDWGERWDSRASELGMLELDFAWFTFLSSFTHWDLERAGPFASFIAKAPDADAQRWPRPNFKVLVDWAKLRLLHGLRTSAPVSAFREVEHLAKLLLSTESIVGISTGIEILQLINQANERFVKNSGDVTKDFRLYDKTLLKKASSASWAINQYVDWRVGSELIARVFPKDSPQPFACAALAERLPMLEIARPLLQEAYETRFATLDTLVDQLASQCRLTTALAQWRDKSRIPEIFQGDVFNVGLKESSQLEGASGKPQPTRSLQNVANKGSAETPSNSKMTLAELQRLPFAKQIMGLVLTQWAPPYLDDYKKDDESGKADAR